MTALDQAFIKAFRQPEPAATGPWTERADRAGDGIGVLEPPPAEVAATPSHSPGAGSGWREVSAWRPSLQVDGLRWPPVCSRIEAAAPQQCEQLAAALDAAVDQGQKTLAIAAARQGEGATTVTLCLARILTLRGRRMSLVDASFADPQLAARLGLRLESGWEDVLAGRVPLEEVTVETVDERLAVLAVREPLTGMAGPRDEITIAENLATLSDHYDLVLIDWGSLERYVAGPSLSRGIGKCLDGLALVQNVRTAGDCLEPLLAAAATAGIPVAGIIHNFTHA